jgi:hypothetical protein
MSGGSKKLIHIKTGSTSYRKLPKNKKRNIEARDEQTLLYGFGGGFRPLPMRFSESGNLTAKPTKSSPIEKVSREKLKKAFPRGQKWDPTSESCVASAPGEKVTPIPISGPR